MNLPQAWRMLKVFIAYYYIYLFEAFFASEYATINRYIEKQKKMHACNI